jgi:hypothetical protein
VEGAAAEGRYVADRHRGEVDATLASIGVVVALDSTLIWHGNRLRHPLTLQSRASRATASDSVCAPTIERFRLQTKSWRSVWLRSTKVWRAWRRRSCCGRGRRGRRKHGAGRRPDLNWLSRLSRTDAATPAAPGCCLCTHGCYWPTANLERGLTRVRRPTTRLVLQGCRLFSANANKLKSRWRRAR